MDFKRFRTIIQKNKFSEFSNSLSDSKNNIKIPLLNTRKVIKRNILLNIQNRTVGSSGKTSGRKKNDSTNRTTNRTINISNSLSKTLNSEKNKNKKKNKIKCFNKSYL